MKVGFVGVGNHALESLIPAIRGLDDVELAAVADSDRMRAESVSQHLGIPNFFESAKAMLHSMELDAVVAACPPDSHEEIVHTALAFGRPVFVEKPPAGSTASLRAMVEVVGDLPTGVGMNFRYASAIRHMKALLDSGEYGRPVHIVAHHLANKPRSSLWGFSELKSVLYAQLIHPIDLLLYFLDSQVDEVSTNTIGGGGDGMTLNLQLTTKNQQVASLVSGTSSDKFYFRIEIVTDTGVLLSCDDLWEVSVSGLNESERPNGLVWARKWTPSPLDRGYVRTGYQVELQAFLNAVSSGTPFSPALRDLLPTYEIMDAFGAEAES